MQNVVTYDVVIDVKNDDLALFPGMTADAHIITAERSNVLRVPLPAIRFNPEGVTRSARAGGQGREGREGSSSEAAAENQGAPGEERHAPGAGTGPGSAAGARAGRPGSRRTRTDMAAS